MITWIQVLLQKHHKVVFSILLAVIIVAFVFTIGSSIPTFSSDASGRQISRKDFYGYDLDNQVQMRDLSMIAQIDLRLAGIEVNGNTLENAVLKHAYLSYLAKVLCINVASTADVKNFIQTRPAFQKEDGSFDPEAFSQFNKFLELQGFENEVIDQILSELVVADKVFNIIAGPGFLLEEEVDLVYKDAHGKWDLSVAELPFAKFNPEIKVEDSALESFYNLNKESFRISDAITADFIFFPASEFTSDKKEATEDELNKFYNKNFTKYIETKDGKTSIKELKDVKAQVLEDIKKADCANKAFVKASSTLDEIYDLNITSQTPEFKKFVQDKKLTLKTLPTIRKTDKALPKEVSQALAKAVLSLSENTFYVDPVLAEDGAYIVFFSKSEPSYIPELKEIKKDVEDAYKAQEKAKLFSSNGAEVKKLLVEKVKQGGKAGFAELAKSKGFEVNEFDGFAFADNSFQNPTMYQYFGVFGSSLPKMKAGDVSDMITMGGNGYIVYASKFVAPEKSADAKDLKELSKNAQDAMRNTSTISVLGKRITEALQ